MRSKVLSRLSLFLVLAMLISTIPLSASAADNEYVLTSIGHTAAVSPADMTGVNSGTLTVPYNSSNLIDLSNGLDISYNTAAYTSASASFPNSATAVVDGEPVTMLLTYSKAGETAVFTTSYSIRVIRAANTAPTFTGTLQKTVQLPGVVSFGAADFNVFYTKNGGGELASIAITGSNPSFGTLKLGDINYVSDANITISDLQAGKLTFAATAAGTVSYIVKAVAAGDPNTQIGSVTLTITVTAAANNEISVTASTLTNTPVLLSESAFKTAFQTATGVALANVKFTLPTPANGKFYYNYKSASEFGGIIASDSIYSVSLLSNIAFVPDANYVGAVTIPFTGYNADNTGFAGKLVITVTEPTASPLLYQTQKDTPISFNASDFSKLSEKITGKPLSYVKFTLPAAESGKLWYKRTSATTYESAVTADTAYNREITPYLSDVNFVPATGYKGTLTISYKGYNTAGTSFKGEIKITVSEAGKTYYFTDLAKKYAWAAEAIQYLYDNGIVQGFKNRHFKPDSSISKGEFISMLCKAFDLTTDKDGNFVAKATQGTQSAIKAYSDKSKGHGSSKETHDDKGYQGKTNLKSSLSRQDAMVLICNALNAAGYTLSAGSETELKTYSDYKKISGYAVNPIAALIKAEILAGDQTKLNPKSKISRAEIAVILYRAIELYNK